MLNPFSNTDCLHASSSGPEEVTKDGRLFFFLTSCHNSNLRGSVVVLIKKVLSSNRDGANSTNDSEGGPYAV